MRAPFAGKYRFVLKYKVIAGAFTFGMLSGDETRWLIYATEGEPPGSDGMVQVDIDLEKGQPFRLLTSNSQPAAVASEYIIRNLRAFWIPE